MDDHVLLNGTTLLMLVTLTTVEHGLQWSWSLLCIIARDHAWFTMVSHGQLDNSKKTVVPFNKTWSFMVV